ncbi:histidine--tRNA ligase [Clostridium sp. YIM B02515]|uniref:Histidine--tRNA ligase n=1 Tax=Clostridium rhizosphaerae TaxID=2803861 RepID=A0ABS1TD20_9CLOT|nr:histidine--tRNA ligase [Clostridium rhizosphaerae]MBL4937261.1 histidine--tRNA ligase [Clostridium rhizosphaerae]
MANKIVKPSTLPGFIEWLPADQIAFNKMMDTIRKNYEKFGFIPVDTPVIEKSEVLLAKGGGDTEKQIYRFTKGDSDLSLRFDLTVPLARFVAQHMSELTFPFRRYQIGKVYRGERNQKGRFREFYQCDIDIIGNGKLSIINDAEIPSIIYSTFTDLGFDSFTIHINNRKVLNGFFDAVGVDNKVDTLRIVDKLDKIGIEAVKEELKGLGLTDESVARIEEFINITGSNDEVLEGLKKLNLDNEEFTLGLEELSKVVYYIRQFGVPDKNFMVDLKIARGLDYYTGTVYETILNDYPGIGSVCSGGRYDNLAEYYTTQKLPGVGISIGLSRLFYQLKEAGFFKESVSSTLTKALVVPMDENVGYSINVATGLKNAGIPSEVFFEDGKFVKKLNYANKLGIPYVIIIGGDEIASGILTLKDMRSGEQFKLTVEEIINKING